MASATFLSMCRQNENSPVRRFTYGGINRSQYIIDIPEIRRDNALSVGTLAIKLDNIAGTWNDFLSDHTELTDNQVQVSMSFGGFVSFASIFFSYTASTIAFHDNGVDPDTITGSANQFLNYNFAVGMPLVVSGSTLNDGTYTITGVTAGTLTLDSADVLADEAAGASVTLTNEKIDLFTGYVESAEFDESEKTVTLNCKDRISTCLDYPVVDTSGTTPAEVIYNYISIYSVRNYPYLLSDIVFNLLTAYGKLDNTAGVGNSDIDYASWQAWAVVVDNGGYDIYDICVVANGESVGTILMKIAQMTESIFWVSGEGKIKFKASLQAVTGQSYDRSDLIVLPYIISMDGRINRITCKWQYDPEFDMFVSDNSGVVTDWESYGPGDEPFTETQQIVDDRIVSHNSTDSAELFMNEKLNRTAAPPRIFNVPTDLLGFVEDLGNDITLDGVLDSPYDDFDLRIEEISFNVMDWTTNITGRFFWTVGELS